MTIRGPKDKAAFKDDPKNWTGYRDHLPACRLNAEPDPDRIIPSVSTIKKAWPKFLGDWIATETATLAWERRNDLDGMGEQGAIAMLVGAADRRRDQAADRGHVIHDSLERMIEGQPPSIYLELDTGDEDPSDWLDTLAAFVADNKPTIVASEVIVFSRFGWVGTFDAVIRFGAGPLAGRTVGADYKSRKPGKAATRYPDEGAQLGAYFGTEAHYWIVEDQDGTLRRMTPLAVDCGAIVSLAPDGYRIYEVDLTHACDVWGHLRRFSEAQRDATAMFTLHQPPKAVVAAPAPANVRLIGSVTPLTKQPATEPKVFDEGAIGDLSKMQAEIESAIEDWARRIESAPAEVTARIVGWAMEATRAGYSFRIHGESGIASARRRGIYGAAVRLAALTVDDDDAREVIATATGLEVQPGHTVGSVLGQLTIEDAAKVRGHLDAVHVGGARQTA